MKLDISGLFPDNARSRNADKSVTGAKRKYTAELGMDTFDIGGMSYPIEDKKPFELHVSRSGSSSIHIEGDVSLTLVMPCDRCLDETRQRISFRLERDIDLSEDSEEDTSYIEDYTVDVDGLIFPEIVSELPTKVLCNADCKGICRVCGTNLNRGSCECDTFVPDPRMAAINEIFQNSVNK